MANIHENRLFYDNYDWSKSGEEWADPWGGSDMQWFGTILPRIHLFLPARSILEIGSGYGRWAKNFLPYCEHLLLTDLTRQCVDACRERFSNEPKVKCFLNDGSSLGLAADGAIDLVFSFHSLVHADDVTMEKYVAEISKKLTPNGVAFLHHSNAGEYVNDVTIDQQLLLDYRDVSMTAEKMRGFARNANLRCSSQELINWETEELLDCFSVLARPNSLWGRASSTFKNPDFIGEMAHWGRMAELYGQGQTQASPPFLYKFHRKTDHE